MKLYIKIRSKIKSIDKQRSTGQLAFFQVFTSLKVSMTCFQLDKCTLEAPWHIGWTTPSLKMFLLSTSLASLTFSLRCCCFISRLGLFAVRALSRWFPSPWVFSPTTRPRAVMKLWLALDPMLISPTERRVATSTVSREAKACFGHRFQITT